MVYAMSSTFIIKYGKLQQWDHFEKSAQLGRFLGWFTKWIPKLFSHTNPEQASWLSKALHSLGPTIERWVPWFALPATVYNAATSTALPGTYIKGPIESIPVKTVFDALR